MPPILRRATGCCSRVSAAKQAPAVSSTATCPSASQAQSPTPLPAPSAGDRRRHRRPLPQLQRCRHRLSHCPCPASCSLAISSTRSPRLVCRCPPSGDRCPPSPPLVSTTAPCMQCGVAIKQRMLCRIPRWHRLQWWALTADCTCCVQRQPADQHLIRPQPASTGGAQLHASICLPPSAIRGAPSCICATPHSQLGCPECRRRCGCCGRRTEARQETEASHHANRN